MSCRRGLCADEPEAPPKRRRVTCAYFEHCARFLESLKLPQDSLDPSCDRCYCNECWTRCNLPELMYVAGEKYELPFGYAGFGLMMPPRAASLRIFDTWHVSYHGLQASVLGSVLQEGGLLLPGDTLLDGSTLEAVHTRGGEHRINLYTSPSVRYAARVGGSAPCKFDGHTVFVVLQCRQQPGYSVCAETVGWAHQHPGRAISKHFELSEIERFTRARASIIPYRVLVKLVPPLYYQIGWFDLPPLSQTLATSTQFRKCSAHELLMEDDVVKATCDIIHPGLVVMRGSIGRLRNRNPSSGLEQVKWSDPRYGVTDVERSQIQKCLPAEFFVEGDPVRATCDLDYHLFGVLVPQGSLGRLKTNLVGLNDVEWSNPQLGVTAVEETQIQKCLPAEILAEGSIVMATCDIDYGMLGFSGDEYGVTVRKGSLGTVNALVNREVFSVEWTGRNLGRTRVYSSQIRKCEPKEFLAKGDIVKATCDLEYSLPGAGGHECDRLVKKDSLGILVSFPDGQQSRAPCAAAF